MAEIPDFMPRQFSCPLTYLALPTVGDDKIMARLTRVADIIADKVICPYCEVNNHIQHRQEDGSCTAVYTVASLSEVQLISSNNEMLCRCEYRAGKTELEYNRAKNEPKH